MGIVLLAGCGARTVLEAVVPDESADASVDVGCPLATPAERPAANRLVFAHGLLALIDLLAPPGIALEVADDRFDVCPMSLPDLPCAAPVPGGTYGLDVPADALTGLRVHAAGYVDWIKPVHSPGGDADDVATLIVAMPSPDLTDRIFEPIGGFPLDRATAIVYVERAIPGQPAELLGRGVPGYRIDSCGARVYYLAPDFVGLDLAAQATTSAGVAIVTDLEAPAWADAALPGTATITVSAPDGEPLCNSVLPEHMWLTSETTSSFEVAAPLFQGHMTYAAFLSCPP